MARLLGVEVETLAAWRRRGYGPRWYRIGKKVRYTESDLREWMNAQAGSRIGGNRNKEPATILVERAPERRRPSKQVRER